ncbi:hypothetical protein [Nocardioides aurantiacus]|uniref:hypothetical protein n=1 Tax=Nocardioides aurantiacus TaxID=86796 RepID=UPI000F4A4EC3|nr:hypothetical protein [Nocardioides aurantiacus]
MLTHDSGRRARRVRRTLLAPAGALGLVLAAAAVTPASADTPAAWEQAPDVSVLGFLLVLVIIPVGIAAVVALLTVLPSMARDKGYEQGAAWRGEPEWFGGPTKGLGAADQVTPEQIESAGKGAGGTSAHW